MCQAPLAVCHERGGAVAAQLRRAACRGSAGHAYRDRPAADGDDPASSVVATVDAGCQPVRVIASADGSRVWVTARASDDLLCFSSARLVSDPAHALVAIVRVGEAPVGLAAVRDGSLIIVADSDRFGASGASADLDVVNVPAALSGGPGNRRSHPVRVVPAGNGPAARRHAAGVELHLRPARSNRRGEHPRWLKPLPQAR
jgi:hypothetical protein